MEIKVVQVEVHEGIHEIFLAINKEGQPAWSKFVGHHITVNDVMYGIIFYESMMKLVEIRSGYALVDLPLEHEMVETFSEEQVREFFGEVVGPTIYFMVEKHGKEDFMKQLDDAHAHITSAAGPKPEGRQLTLKEAMAEVARQSD